VNEEWSNDQKKKIDCNNPKGFSQKAHCAGRKKRQAGKQTKYFILSFHQNINYHQIILNVMKI
jgi:hypothetical protein